MGYRHYLYKVHRSTVEKIRQLDTYEKLTRDLYPLLQGEVSGMDNRQRTTTLSQYGIDKHLHSGQEIVCFGKLYQDKDNILRSALHRGMTEGLFHPDIQDLLDRYGKARRVGKVGTSGFTDADLTLVDFVEGATDDYGYRVLEKPALEMVINADCMLGQAHALSREARRYRAVNSFGHVEDLRVQIFEILDGHMEVHGLESINSEREILVSGNMLVDIRDTLNSLITEYITITDGVTYEKYNYPNRFDPAYLPINGRFQSEEGQGSLYSMMAAYHMMDWENEVVVYMGY